MRDQQLPRPASHQQPETDMTRQLRRCAPCINAVPPRYCKNQRPCIDCIVSGEEFQDWGYDERDQLFLLSHDQALLPLVVDTGAVMPPDPDASVFASRPSLQYQNPSRQQDNAGNEYGFGFDQTASRAPVTAIQSERQEIRDNPSIDLTQFQQDLTPFADVRRSSRDQNLQ